MFFLIQPDPKPVSLLNSNRTCRTTLISDLVGMGGAKGTYEHTLIISLKRWKLHVNFLSLQREPPMFFLPFTYYAKLS